MCFIYPQKNFSSRNFEKKLKCDIWYTSIRSGISACHIDTKNPLSVEDVSYDWNIKLFFSIPKDSILVGVSVSRNLFPVSISRQFARIENKKWCLDISTFTLVRKLLFVRYRVKIQSQLSKLSNPGFCISILSCHSYAMFSRFIDYVKRFLRAATVCWISFLPEWIPFH